MGVRKATLREITDPDLLEGDVISSTATTSKTSGLKEISDPDLSEGEVVISKPAIDRPKLSKEIAKIESNGGNYLATNPNSSATGKYQFLWSQFGDDIKRITGVKDQQEFLHNPTAQEKFFNYHLENNLGPSVEKIRRFNAKGYSDSQLAKLVHFKGEQGAINFLQSGSDATKAHNVSIPSYIGKPEGQTQTAETPQITGQEQPTTPQPGNLPHEDWTQPTAVVDDVNNPQGISQGMHPRTNTPINYPKQTLSEDQAKKTLEAHSILSSDLMEAASNSHIPEYSDNVKNVPFNDPNSVVHKITDPHGDPSWTGGFFQYRMAQLDRDKEKELAHIPAGMTVEDIEDKYTQKKQQLQDATQHTTGLQIANQDYNKNKYTPAQAEQKINDLTEEEKKKRSEATTKAEKDEITTQYSIQKGEVRDSKKYDALSMGMQQGAFMGDKEAEKDFIKYRNGQPIDISRKAGYQYMGLHLLQTASQNAKASGQTEVGNEMASNSDNIYERLVKDNPEFYRKQWGNEIGNYVYNHVDNPLYGTILSRPKLSDADIKKYGKEAGLTDGQIKMIKPEDVPTSSSIYGQAAQAAFNTLTFKNENDPGGKFFTGDMPSDQKQANNWRGVVGEMASGASTVGAFMLQGGIVGRVLKGAELLGDVATGAKRYETAANMIPLAASNYHNAYETSKEVIGDKPEDEGKRLLYSLVDGTISTALMSIDPATKIGKEALAGPAGKDFVNMLKKNSIEDLTEDAFKKNIEKTIEKIAIAGGATAEHVASQSFIMGANQIGQNLTKMAFDPEHRYGVMDNVGTAALQGGISMFLPSLFSGIHTAKSSSPAHKELLWEVGNNPKQYRQEVTSLFKEGKMTADEFHTAIDGIGRMAVIVKNQVPTESVISNKKLSPDQQQEYAYNLLVTDKLNDKLELLNNSETPDKSQVKLVQDRISELANERTDILNNAGELPEQEKPFRKPVTELGSSEVSTQKKSSEKVANTEENNIPLTSQEKPHENGNENEAKNIPSSQGVRHEASLQESQDHQGGNETGREDRPLKPTPTEGSGSEQSEPVVKQPPATTAKERRKQFIQEHPELKSPEEKPGEIPIVEEPALQTQDLGKVKGLPESQTAKAVEKTTINHPDKPADILVADKPAGESFNEAKDRFKGAVEEIAKDAPDNTVVMTHSWGIKLLKAAENHGWDHPDLGAEHQKLSTEPGDLIPYKTPEGKIIWFARHGETEDNEKNLQRTNGTTLTEKGQQQAKAIAGQLKELGVTPSQIITSDLPRAKESSDIIQKEFAPPDKKINTDVKVETGKATIDGHYGNKLEGSDGNEKATEKLNQRSEPSTERRNDVKPEPPASETKPSSGIKDITKDIVHTPKGSYAKGDNIKPGDHIRYTKGNGTKYGIVSNEIIKRNNNKDLIGSYKIKEVRNRHQMDYPTYNANKKSIENSGFEPRTLEEAALLHMMGGGKFRMGTEEVPGIERHLSTRKDSEENTAARDKWLAAHDDPKSEKIANADQFGYEFNEKGEQNEAEIAEVLSTYRNQSEVVARLAELVKERQKEDETPREHHRITYYDSETGETHDVELDPQSPHYESDLAKLMGHEEDMPAAFSEEGHPIFEEGLVQENAIMDAKVSEQDNESLYNLWDKHTDENGKLDVGNFITELHQNKEAYEPEVQEIIDKLQPFNTDEENKPYLEQLKQKADEYESANRKRADEIATQRQDSESGPPGGKPVNAEEGGTDKTAQDYASEISDIDEQLKKEKAALHQYRMKADIADKSGDIEEGNKQTQFAEKKQVKIDRLIEQREELSKQQDRAGKDEIKNKYKVGADRIRQMGKKLSTSLSIAGMEEVDRASLFGIKANSIEWVADRIAALYEKLGNVEYAIRKAFAEYRQSIKGEKEQPTAKDERLALDYFNVKFDVKKKEPQVIEATQKLGELYLDDIREGGFSLEEAKAEIMEDGDMADKTKSDLFNYLDWHINDREQASHENRTNPDNKNNYLHNFPERPSEGLTRYLSGDTIADVHGRDVQFDIDSKESLNLDNVVKDQADMIGTAKYHAGSDDVLVYGEDMLGQIKSMPQDIIDQAAKKLKAVVALHNEINAELTRAEHEIATSIDDGHKNALKKRTDDLNRMRLQTESTYTALASSASDIMNIARTNRMFRDTYLQDLYADKILNEKQQREKAATEKALETTHIDEDIVENATRATKSDTDKKEAIRNEEKGLAPDEAKKPVADAGDVTGGKKTEVPEKGKKPMSEEKKKNFIARMAEARKKNKAAKEKESKKYVKKQEAILKKIEEKVTGAMGSNEERLNKLRELFKKPC